MLIVARCPHSELCLYSTCYVFSFEKLVKMPRDFLGMLYNDGVVHMSGQQ